MKIFEHNKDRVVACSGFDVDYCNMCVLDPSTKFNRESYLISHGYESVVSYAEKRYTGKCKGRDYMWSIE